MPRRVADYAVQYTDFNMIATVGAFIFGFSQLIFLYIIFATIRGGKKASDRVWEGSHGLEWTLSSPPPYHSFPTPPKIES